MASFSDMRKIAKALLLLAMEQALSARKKELVALLLVDRSVALQWLRDMHDLAVLSDSSQWQPIVVSKSLMYGNAVDAFLYAEACILGSFVTASEDQKKLWVSDLTAFTTKHNSDASGLESLVVSIAAWLTKTGQADELEEVRPLLDQILDQEMHGAGLPGIRFAEDLGTEPPSTSITFISSATMHDKADELRQALTTGAFGAASMAMRSMNDDPAAVGMTNFERDLYCGITAVVVGTCAGLAASTVMTPAGGTFVGTMAGVAYDKACVAMIQTDEERAEKREQAKAAEDRAAQWDAIADLATSRKEASHTAHQQAQADAVEARHNANNPPANATDEEKAALEAVAQDAEEKEREAAAALERAEEEERVARERAEAEKSKAEEEDDDDSSTYPNPDETAGTGIPPELAAAMWRAVAAVRRQQAILPNPEGPARMPYSPPFRELGPLIYPRSDPELQGVGGVLRSKATAIDPSPDAVAVTLVPIKHGDEAQLSSAVAARVDRELASQERTADGRTLIRSTTTS